MDQVRDISDKVAAAEKVLEATPSLETQVAEFGEDKLVDEPGGKYRIDLTDKHGQVDMRKVHLAKEMFQDRSRAEVRMAETRDRYVDRSKLDERARYERWIAEGRKKRR